MSFDLDAEKNSCSIGENVRLEGFIKGQHNTVVIDPPTHECRIDLRISGITTTSIFALHLQLKG